MVAPVTITNTVLKDETGLRGPDYTVFQELVEVKSGGASYTRTAIPGQNQFGEWTEASFDSDSYYTKLRLTYWLKVSKALCHTKLVLSN